jgi:RNA recognition motif-containing protein
MASWIISAKQTPSNGVKDNHGMSFTVFLGNLPTWVTADDIKGWLTAENLVADAIKVIRNPETQESKGFAFIESPNTEEMNSIIRRFDRAPLEDRLLRANPAQPARPKGPTPGGRPMGGPGGSPAYGGGGQGYSRPSHGGPPHQHGTPQGSPQGQSQGQPQASHASAPPSAQGPASQAPVADQRPPRRGKRSNPKRGSESGPQSPFAEELAKVL